MNKKTKTSLSGFRDFLFLVEMVEDWDVITESQILLIKTFYVLKSFRVLLAMLMWPLAKGILQKRRILKLLNWNPTAVKCKIRKI